ncbi:hypothetical protein IV203_021416 [Nitzschia inconspicua]|uniref:Uncharacterized protein n=1 Tax=Nitzschia inconspicua TaxID=303405 RepID=A0A9K3KHS9_9STRA|nr:hypothetical protein IV203_021416 [Nitzschia inconspicua]
MNEPKKCSNNDREGPPVPHARPPKSKLVALLVAASGTFALFIRLGTGSSSSYTTHADRVDEKENHNLTNSTRIIDLYAIHPPTPEQLEFNYTRRVRHEGYSCRNERPGSSSTEIFYEASEEVPEDLNCIPLIWFSKDLNCNMKNFSDNLCLHGDVNWALTELKLDGTQSCLDASNAMILKYCGETEDLRAQCHKRTRKLGNLVRTVDLYSEHPPTREQVIFNYTKKVKYEGFACTMHSNQSDSQEIFFETSEERPRNAQCEPLVWYNKDVNCDKDRRDDNLCIDGRVNLELSKITLNGTQSCVDASNAMKLKFEGLNSEMVEQCKLVGSGRRLNWCDGKLGTCQHYSSTCGTNSDQYLFNWAFSGRPQTGLPDDLTLHHHAWQMQDNIAGWSNYPSINYQQAAIPCLQKYQRVRLRPGIDHDYFEGNYIWKCRCMARTRIHTRGFMKGNMLLDADTFYSVKVTDTCVHRRRQQEKWSAGSPSFCQLDVEWDGPLTSTGGARSNPIASGWN